MSRRALAWSIPLLLILPACDGGKAEANKEAKPDAAKTKDPAEPEKAEPAKAVDHGGFTVVEIPNEGELSAILTDHAAKAKAAGQTAHIEFWADWCGPCKELEASMEDERMKKAFAGTYILRMNFDHWTPKLAGTGLESASIPVFFELDAAGKPTGRTINGGAWAENIPENMAPPLTAYFRGERS